LPGTSLKAGCILAEIQRGHSGKLPEKENFADDTFDSCVSGCRLRHCFRRHCGAEHELSRQSGGPPGVRRHVALALPDISQSTSLLRHPAMNSAIPLTWSLADHTAAGFPIATRAFSARARLIRAISSVDGHSGERDAFQPIRTDPHDDCGDSCRSNYSQIGGKQVKRRFHCRGDGFLPERFLYPLRSSAAKWRDILWWLWRTANNIITSGRIAFHGFGLMSRGFIM
jgi:hypothetical protein